MLTSSLAPYLLWAKSRQPAAVDLAGSNLLHCALEDLPGAREALDLTAPNDDGYAPVVDAIAAHYRVDRARVSCATGCSGANFLVAAALLGAGDDVLIERPTYDPLIGVCRLMGASIHRFDRTFGAGFGLDPDAVAHAITPQTKLIIITSPHNPSGAAAADEALRAVIQTAEGAGAHVLVDEVYLDAASSARGAHGPDHSAARFGGPVIVTASLTKSYGLAGLKSGWAIAPPAIAERLRRTRDLVDNAGSAPSDRLAALAWSLLPQLTARAGRILGGNLERAREFFVGHPQFELAERPWCSVTFPRIAGVSDADAWVQQLLNRHGVAVAPGRFFEAPAHFRISLAGRPAGLDAGLAALSAASREILSS
jgi:aspartate/methionine/tyrosine aminotransferase